MSAVPRATRRAIIFLMSACCVALTLWMPAQAESQRGPEPTLAPATAKDSLLVVELFTSQACATCPPADKLLSEIAKRPGILALTLPVNYWDYLGWKDTLATYHNVRRQKFYARHFDETKLYTPQMVIGGVIEAVGSNRAAVERAITAARKLRGPQVPIYLQVVKGRLDIRIPAMKGFSSQPRTVWIAYFDDNIAVAIKRGENRGRKLTYTNVLRQYAAIGVWAGKEIRLSLPYDEILAGDYDNCAIFVQNPRGGVIVGAVQLRLKNRIAASENKILSERF